MQKKKLVLLGLVAAAMLTGCGGEPLYELTEAEQQLIVNYSAHVVSKYNTYQKDGLTYVIKQEETEEEETTIEETETTETQMQETDSVKTDVSTETSDGETAQAANLTDFFVDTGLEITYTGYEIADTYFEDDIYALKPSYGKTLVILKLQAKNPTDAAITVDNLSNKNTFSLKGKMNGELDYHTPAVMSLLTKDFVTYEGTIEAGETEELVLIFEVPKDTTSIENPALRINKNKILFEINL